MATDTSNLDVVNFLSLQEREIGIVISNTSQELNISEKLPTITFSELKISNNEIVIIHIFHCDCSCGSVECTLILISVINL
jgi:hypothetical protein